MQKRTFTIPENSKVLHSFKKRGKRIDFIVAGEDKEGNKNFIIIEVIKDN